MKVYFDKNTKDELLKYGGSYQCHAIIYRYENKINSSVKQSKFSSRFIAGDVNDAILHFDKIIKRYQFQDKGNECVHYKIEKLDIERQAVNDI